MTAKAVNKENISKKLKVSTHNTGLPNKSSWCAVVRPGFTVGESRISRRHGLKELLDSGDVILVMESLGEEFLVLLKSLCQK